MVFIKFCVLENFPDSELSVWMAVLAAVGRAAARLETDEQIKVNNLKQQIDCHKNSVRRSENCPSGQLSKAFPQLDHYLMAREMISRELFS